ncbi:MAG: IPT/TIG domain-containing protein, partial [Dysgonamonadaceae bacterium]|nr:IPT/TIG domain-containing protein [Dysgonamonadaceae bacterium]
MVPHDPSIPIVFDRFSPDSGRVATQMLIYGSNFGCDKSQINVSVKDKKAAVIGVSNDGTIIYCIVPSFRGSEFRNSGDLDSGYVKVQIGDREVTSTKPMVYTYTQNVSTFLGFTDQDGNTAIVDGAFEKAQFQSPFWLAFDSYTDANGLSRKDIYLIEENNGLRYINMHDRTVSTVFRTGNGVDRPRTIAFTLNRDTMIIANDHGDWSGIGTIVLARDSVSRQFKGPWRAVMHHKQCNGGAVHPISGDYWFNSYSKSQVYKVFDRKAEIWRYGSAPDKLNEDGKDGNNYFFRVQDDSWEFNIQIAPSG